MPLNFEVRWRIRKEKIHLSRPLRNYSSITSLFCDNSVTTQQCHNTTVSQHNSVTTQQCHNTTVSQHNSVTTQQCHNSTVSQHNSVTTQQCHNTTVSQFKICDFSGEKFKSFEML